MKHYFSLQKKMLDRRLTEFGLPPIIAYVLAGLFFIGFSTYLFYKIAAAEYLYLFLAINAISRFSEKRRNEFLELCYAKNKYLAIRCLENISIALPFCLFLVIKQHFLTATLIGVLAGILAVVKLKNSWNFTLPTPFYRYPFEFTVGFRQSFLLIFGIYIISIIAIVVGNFNLGLVALFALSLVAMAFYFKPEAEFFVWIFADTPQQFLFKKIKTAILYTFILSLPISLSLSVFYTEQVLLILGVQLLGVLFVVLALLGKYAAFPNEINMPQAFAVGLTLLFPPLLLVFIPLFYRLATKQLRRY